MTESLSVPSDTSPVRNTRIARLRRSSFVALIAVLLQFGLGMGVSLYATVPSADHGAMMGNVLSNGPAVLTTHVIVGLVLILAGLGLLVQAIVARQLRVVVLSLVGLASLVFAASEGSSFVDKGHAGASLGMALATGLAIGCYGTILFLDLPGRARRAAGVQ